MGKGTITGGGTAGLYQVDIEYNIEYLKKKKEQILKLIEECEKKIDAVELEITPIINKINDIYVEIRDLTAESSLLSAELTPLREQVEPLAQEIKTLKSEISELEGEIAGLEAEKARLEGLEETPEILAQIAVIESNINYKKFSRDNKQAELDLNEANLSNINSQISEKESQIKANLKTLDVKEQELQEQQRFRDSLERKKKILMLYLLSYQKKIADINSVNETENKDVWCVDYSENIEAETVGLIEVHEENATRYNIRPGYDPDLVVYDSARDGQESPIKAQTAAQAFYNLALFPAWQKWKPFYRYAVITEKRGNVADVDILDYKSPYQNIDINKLKSLTDVDIEYMSCNGAAFEIDDVVVVQFDGNSWDTPKIIGFKEEPKECPTFIIKINSINGTNLSNYSAWSLRLTQPIEQYVDAKGGYTEEYTVITEYKMCDSSGVVIFNLSSDAIQPIDKNYPVNVWLNNPSIHHGTTNIKTYPDLYGNYMYPIEFRVESLADWNDPDTQARLALADFAVEFVNGIILFDNNNNDIDLTSYTKTSFFDSQEVEYNGYLVDFIGLKAIQMRCDWRTVNTFQAESNASNSYTEYFPSFVGPYAGDYWQPMPKYRNFRGVIGSSYYYVVIYQENVGDSLYTYYCPMPATPITYELTKCGSIIITDRKGKNHTYQNGHEYSYGAIFGGPIDLESPDYTGEYGSWSGEISLYAETRWIMVDRIF